MSLSIYGHLTNLPSPISTHIVCECPQIVLISSLNDQTGCFKLYMTPWPSGLRHQSLKITFCYYQKFESGRGNCNFFLPALFHYE